MKYFILLLISSLFLDSAYTCTIFSFSAKNQKWIGRNFDWSYGHGYIYKNNRLMKKSGLKLFSSDVPGSWISKYGSITFNQFGKEFPNGGMNEEGLVVEALQLKDSRYPEADDESRDKSSLNELQFIQYALDNHASVESLRRDLRNIRIAPVGSKLHYFACDVKQCMTIEYIDGQLITNINSDLEIPSLANSTYSEHLDYARDFVTFGGKKPIEMNSKKSLDRFVRASFKAKFVDTFADPVAHVFDILDGVALRSNRWQIIYNQTAKTITFKTKARPGLKREIDLKNFSYECESPVKFFDIENTLNGMINTEFKDFSSETNSALIRKSFHEEHLPKKLVDIVSKNSESLICNH